MHKYMNYNKTKLINGKTYQFLIFCYIFILHALEVIQNCMVERVCQQLCFFSYSTSEILHWSLAIPHCAFMSQKSSDAINQGFSSQIPWRRVWQSTSVFLPGESHVQRSLEGYSPLGHKESDTTEQLTLPLLLLDVVEE